METDSNCDDEESLEQSNVVISECDSTSTGYEPTEHLDGNDNGVTVVQQFTALNSIPAAVEHSSIASTATLITTVTTTATTKTVGSKDHVMAASGKRKKEKPLVGDSASGADLGEHSYSQTLTHTPPKRAKGGLRKDCPPFCKLSCKKDHHPLLISARYVVENNGDSTCQFLEKVARYYGGDLGQMTFSTEIYDPGKETSLPLLHYLALMGKVFGCTSLVMAGHFPSHSLAMNGDSVLHTMVREFYNFACTHGHMDVLQKKFKELLDEFRICLYINNSMNETPFHLLSKFISDTASILIDPNRGHRTPFRIYQFRKNMLSVCLDVLETNNPDSTENHPVEVMNRQDMEGNTAAHYIAFDRASSVLLERMEKLGSNFSLRNMAGQSVEDIKASAPPPPSEEILAMAEYSAKDRFYKKANRMTYKSKIGLKKELKTELDQKPSTTRLNSTPYAYSIHTPETMESEVKVESQVHTTQNISAGTSTATQVQPTSAPVVASAKRKKKKVARGCPEVKNSISPSSLVGASSASTKKNKAKVAQGSPEVKNSISQMSSIGSSSDPTNILSLISRAFVSTHISTNVSTITPSISTVSPSCRSTTTEPFKVSHSGCSLNNTAQSPVGSLAIPTNTFTLSSTPSLVRTVTDAPTIPTTIVSLLFAVKPSTCSSTPSSPCTSSFSSALQTGSSKVAKITTPQTASNGTTSVAISKPVTVKEEPIDDFPVTTLPSSLTVCNASPRCSTKVSTPVSKVVTNAKTNINNTSATSTASQSEAVPKSVPKVSSAVTNGNISSPLATPVTVKQEPVDELPATTMPPVRSSNISSVNHAGSTHVPQPVSAAVTNPSTNNLNTSVAQSVRVSTVSNTMTNVKTSVSVVTPVTVKEEPVDEVPAPVMVARPPPPPPGLCSPPNGLSNITISNVRQVSSLPPATVAVLPCNNVPKPAQDVRNDIFRFRPTAPLQEQRSTAALSPTQLRPLTPTQPSRTVPPLRPRIKTTPVLPMSYNSHLVQTMPSSNISHMPTIVSEDTLRQLSHSMGYYAPVSGLVPVPQYQVGGVYLQNVSTVNSTHSLPNSNMISNAPVMPNLRYLPISNTTSTNFNAMSSNASFSNVGLIQMGTPYMNANNTAPRNFPISNVSSVQIAPNAVTNNRNPILKGNSVRSNTPVHNSSALSSTMVRNRTPNMNNVRPNSASTNVGNIRLNSSSYTVSNVRPNNTIINVGSVRPNGTFINFSNIRPKSSSNNVSNIRPKSSSNNVSNVRPNSAISVSNVRPQRFSSNAGSIRPNGASNVGNVRPNSAINVGNVGQNSVISVGNAGQNNSSTRVRLNNSVNISSVRPNSTSSNVSNIRRDSPSTNVGNIRPNCSSSNIVNARPNSSASNASNIISKSISANVSKSVKPNSSAINVNNVRPQSSLVNAKFSAKINSSNSSISNATQVGKMPNVNTMHDPSHVKLNSAPNRPGQPNISTTNKTSNTNTARLTSQPAATKNTTTTSRIEPQQSNNSPSSSETSQAPTQNSPSSTTLIDIRSLTKKSKNRLGSSVTTAKIPASASVIVLDDDDDEPTSTSGTNMTPNNGVSSQATNDTREVQSPSIGSSQDWPNPPHFRDKNGVASFMKTYLEEKGSIEDLYKYSNTKKESLLKKLQEEREMIQEIDREISLRKSDIRTIRQQAMNKEVGIADLQMKLQQHQSGVSKLRTNREILNQSLIEHERSMQTLEEQYQLFKSWHDEMLLREGSI